MAYDMSPSKGGGFIGGSTGLTYMGKTGIVTPMFEEIDLETDLKKKVNTKQLFHVKAL